MDLRVARFFRCPHSTVIRFTESKPGLKHSKVIESFLCSSPSENSPVAVWLAAFPNRLQMSIFQRNRTNMKLPILWYPHPPFSTNSHIALLYGNALLFLKIDKIILKRSCIRLHEFWIHSSGTSKNTTEQESAKLLIWWRFTLSNNHFYILRLMFFPAPNFCTFFPSLFSR